MNMNESIPHYTPPRNEGLTPMDMRILRAIASSAPARAADLCRLVARATGTSPGSVRTRLGVLEGAGRIRLVPAPPGASGQHYILSAPLEDAEMEVVVRLADRWFGGSAMRGADAFLLASVAEDEDELVCDRQVQVDRSGVGHCWVDVSAADIPARILEEIEGEMIDGREDCDDFVASNGLHYRW